MVNEAEETDELRVCIDPAEAICGDAGATFEAGSGATFAAADPDDAVCVAGNVEEDEEDEEVEEEEV